MPAHSTRRPPLTRARIVEAAVAAADRGGVAAVSMRKVAETLDVEGMALYHHVANKDAILDAIVDAVFAEIEVPAQADWRAALESRCWSARAALTRHSWVLGLIESRDHVGPHRLHHHDAVLGVLLGAGMSPVDAVLAVSVLDSFVYGFVLQEKQLRLPTPEDAQEAATELVAAMSADELPHLRTVAEAVSTGPAPSQDEAFAHGLGVILDGLAPAPRGSAG